MSLKNPPVAIIIFLLFIFIPLTTQAASLFIDPPTGQLAPGDTVIAKIKIDNQGECINAAEISLHFSENLRAVDFSSGNSILNIWIDQPGKSDMNRINLEKHISFSGGIPGGYCGPVRGDQGESNILAEAVFTVVDTGSTAASINFGENPLLLLNDGKGTPASVAGNGAKYDIVSSSTAEGSEWSKRLEEDNIAPEPFTVELLRDSRVYEGKYYIIFATSDKQTGIDHYEVMEQSIVPINKPKLLKKFIKEKVPQWKVGQSPYLLEDQSLGSDIYVKAIDKSGNEKTVKYSAKAGELTQGKSSFLKDLVMVILSIMIVIALVPIFYRIIRIFKKNLK